MQIASDISNKRFDLLIETDLVAFVEQAEKTIKSCFSVQFSKLSLTASMNSTNTTNTSNTTNTTTSKITYTGNMTDCMVRITNFVKTSEQYLTE